MLRMRSSSPPRLAVAWLLAVALSAAAAPWLAPWGPARQDLAAGTVPPGGSGHWLGTDDLGRDVMSRLIWASRTAIMVGSVTVLGSGLVGTVLGLVAGVSGRGGEEAIMLLMDGVLAIPTVLLAITVVAILGTGLFQVILALAVVFSPVFARLARAETKEVLSATYIDASRSLGTSWPRIVVRRILPNIAGPLVVQAALTFALAIVIESSLSYLGLGTQPPDASWGLMLKDGRGYMVQAPWLSIAPGVTITLTVLACNVAGDALAERFDPRLRAQVA
jgi:peptide/nickel transport system permease protein